MEKAAEMISYFPHYVMSLYMQTLMLLLHLQIALIQERNKDKRLAGQERMMKLE